MHVQASDRSAVTADSREALGPNLSEMGHFSVTLLASASSDEIEMGLVKTPHLPIVQGLRFLKILDSLTFAANGHFSS